MFSLHLLAYWVRHENIPLKLKRYQMSMTEFMKFVKCENEGVFDIKQMYSAEKAFKKMQNHRNLHFAYMGMRVNVAGKWGTIVGNWKTNLFVLFDGEIEAYNCPLIGKLLTSMKRAMWFIAVKRESMRYK